MTHALELQGVRKTFGSKVAVENLDLTIEAGGLYGLIGPNGAGKTTSIRIIMSIIFPDAGRVAVLGRASAVESKDRIGYLPEERGLYKKMRVGAFLQYIAHLKGVPQGDVGSLVKRWLDKVGLSDCARKRCEELSKGMQQKVQFIASVIHEPDLLILDEPFSGLDPVNARLLRELILEQHAQGRTIIFSTHQMSQAESLCDRIIMIHQGRKVLDNTPEEIARTHDPRSLLVEPAGELTEEALRTLGQAPGAAGADRSGRFALIHAADGHPVHALIPDIAQRLPMRRVEVVRPTLEDIFIAIVQGKGASAAEREALLASLRSSATASDGSGD